MENNELEESIFVELEQEFKEDLDKMRNKLNSISLPEKSKLQNYNFIVFGPTGAGKSSFIRTVFSAYRDSYQNSGDVSENLVIQGTKANEGTTRFSWFQLREFQKNVMEVGKRKIVRKNAGIRLFDTRGQIFLDQKENAHIDLMLTVIEGFWIGDLVEFFESYGLLILGIYEEILCMNLASLG